MRQGRPLTVEAQGMLELKGATVTIQRLRRR